MSDRTIGGAYLEGTVDAYGEIYAFLMGAAAGSDDNTARKTLVEAANWIQGQRTSLLQAVAEGRKEAVADGD